MKAKAYAIISIILVLLITPGIALDCDYAAGENCKTKPNICPCDLPDFPHCDPSHADADARGCWGEGGPPISHCGDGTCLATDGEDCNTCAHDCGCPSGDVCKSDGQCGPDSTSGGGGGDSGYKCCESTQGMDACAIALDQPCPPMFEDLPDEWVDPDNPSNCIHPGPGAPNPPECPTDGSGTSTGDYIPPRPPSDQICGNCHWECKFEDKRSDSECDSQCRSACDSETASGTETDTYQPSSNDQCQHCIDKCKYEMHRSSTECEGFCEYDCSGTAEEPTPTLNPSTTYTSSGDQCDNCMDKCKYEMGRPTTECEGFCEYDCSGGDTDTGDFDTSTPCGKCEYECEVVQNRPSYECDKICNPQCNGEPLFDNECDKCFYQCTEVEGNSDFRCKDRCQPDCEGGKEPPPGNECDKCFYQCIDVEGNSEFRCKDRCQPICEGGKERPQDDECGDCFYQCTEVEGNSEFRCKDRCRPICEGGAGDRPPPKPPLYDRCGTCKWKCEFEQNRPPYECQKECDPLCGESEDPFGSDESDLPEPPSYAFRDRPMEGGFVGRPILLKLNEPVDVCGMQFEALAIKPEERVLRIKAVWPDGKSEEVRINVDKALEGTLHGFVKHFDTVSLLVPKPDDGEDKPLIARNWAVLAALIRTDCKPYPLSALAGGPGEEPTEGPGDDDAIVADIEILDDGRFITKLERGQWTLVCNRRVRYLDLKDGGTVAVVEADTGIRMRELLFKADTFHDEDGREVTDEQRVGLNKVQALKDGFSDGNVLVIIVRPDLRCSEELKQQTGEQPVPGEGGELPSRMICCQPEEASAGGACMVPMQGRCPRGFKTLENEWVDPDSENNCIADRGVRRPFCRVSPPDEEGPQCGDGKCQENETSETCCKDCGCPEDMTCRDDTCVARAPDNTRQCDTFCGRVTEPEICSFACMSCPDCTDKSPPWPCLTECVEAETGIGMSDLCDKRCSRSKDPETCNLVCGSCNKCLFMKDANKCLKNCAKDKLKIFAKRCDDICDPFGEKDVCNPICRDCRKCVVDPDDTCAEECVNERRGTMKDACEETCADGDPECVDKCLECRKCTPELGKDGLKVCLRSCLDSQGMKKKMLDMLKKVQAEDNDMARRILVASALDDKKKERFHKAISDSRRAINNQRVDDAKQALEDLEKQLSELKELEMKVRVLEKKVITVRKKVERKNLANHVSKFVKNRAVDEGDNVTDDTADEIANETIEVEEGEINITLEAEVLEVEDGDTTENVSVFTISVKNLKDKNLTGVTIIQSIPKEIAESASELVFAGAVTIIEDDPIVGWDLSMLEEEEEKKLSFSTKKKVNLEAVADTETAAVKVAVEEVEVNTIEQEMASEEGTGSTEETKQAMVERIEASSDQPTGAVEPVEGVPADKPAETGPKSELPFGLSSKDLRGLLLVLMAVVVLVAMVKTGITTGGTSSVSAVEQGRLEEAFGHGEVISVEEDADEVVTKIKSPVKVEKKKKSSKAKKSDKKSDAKETEGEGKKEDKDNEEEEDKEEE
ncbi:MAG: hypothetical protein QGG26_09250 [Candidatus Undinarchaeales archaeon]|nr:hypothetical protein [Candidatus Undinarchaeales archaeon]